MPSPTLADIRAHAARELDRLPEHLRRLAPGTAYPVNIAEALVLLTNEVDSRLVLAERCHG
jgi:nicotinate phosphoribosyltransferase